MSSRQVTKAIIIASSRDFGRCPFTTYLPTALWPLAGKSVLENLLIRLSSQGIKQATICSRGDSSLLARSIHTNCRLELKFLDEQLPSGTAGCIRDAAVNEKDGLFVVLPAAMICPPKISTLISAHQKGRSDLTVMFNPGRSCDRMLGEPSGIYIGEASLLEHIPKEGYFDIKEGLIPEMLSVGKTVHTAVLPHHVGNFRDWRRYLYAVTNYLENNPQLSPDLKLCKHNNLHEVWVAPDVKMESGARIYGPVVIMDRARISDGAIIFGPTIIGRDVGIERDSVVVNSVLWDGVRVGPNCQVRCCLIDHNVVVKGNTIVEEKAVPFKQKAVLQSAVAGASGISKNSSNKLLHALQTQLGKLNRLLPESIQSRKAKILPWFAAGFVLIAFLWSYWPSIMELWNIWQRSDEHSSGLLVPFLTLYILWSRRHDIAQCPIRPSIWGLPAFLAAQTIRFIGLYDMYISAEHLSVILSVVALVLLLFGFRMLRKVSTVLLFLCLMFPWPTRVQALVTLPLQRWSTSSAVFCLEVIGYEVVQQGNVINIGQASVAVAEACNGLRMITAFFVISGLVVMLIKRAWWEKLIVLLSSLPIALLCNTVRLAITAIAFTVLSGEQWEKIFHDFGGYAMMPLAIAAVVAELWLLANLTTLPVKEEAVIITRKDSDRNQT